MKIHEDRRLRIVAITFLILLSGCFTGCRYYYKVTTVRAPGKDQIAQYQSESKYFIVHQGSRAWHLDSTNLTDKSFLGIKTDLTPNHLKYITTENTKPNRYRKGNVRDESCVLKEVHLYLKDTTAIENGIGNKIIIPLAGIPKVEIYTKDKGATLSSWLIPGIGIPVFLGVAGLIAVSEMDNMFNIHLDLNH